MLVFIDESGDPGMKGKTGSSRVFVITAILFEDHDEAESCDEKIDRLREELHLNPKFEFHFNSCGDSIRQRFLETVSCSGFFYQAVVLNKAKLWGKGFEYKESFYKYAAGLVFENAKPRLLQAKVVIDKCGNREFRQQLAKYLMRQMNDGQKILIKKVAMQPSHANNLLQLADMVCGSVFRSFNTTKSNRMAFRRIISAREIGVQVWPK